MSTSTVTIGSNTATVWGSTALIDAYLLTDGDFYDAWLAATATERALKHVRATRIFDRLPWRDAVVPYNEADVLEAVYELAGTLTINPAIMGGAGGGAAQQGAVRSVSDGQQRADFQFSTKASKSGMSTLAGLPRDIFQRIRPFIKTGDSTALMAYATGTDGESIFDDDDVFTLEEGL